MDPIISVLIPVYNVEKYIEKCLTSLFTNTFAVKCEFIITDDCSTDNSIVIAKQVLSKFPSLFDNVKFLYHAQNKGLAGARKTGLQAATGKYILNVDSDDYVEPNFLEEFIFKAQETNSDLIGCGYFIENENKSTDYIQDFSNNKIECLKKIISDEYKSYLWCKLFKREIILKNNLGPVEGINLWEDYVFCIQYFSYSNSFSSIQKPLYHYIQRNNSLVHEQMTEKKASDMINAINYSENFLRKNFTKEIFENNFYKELNTKKNAVKYYTIIEGSLILQKKFYKIWPETYESINECGLGRTAKITLKKCAKASFFAPLLLFFNSMLLIKRKIISFKDYFRR